MSAAGRDSAKLKLAAGAVGIVFGGCLVAVAATDPAGDTVGGSHTPDPGARFTWYAGVGHVRPTSGHHAARGRVLRTRRDPGHGVTSASFAPRRISSSSNMGF